MLYRVYATLPVMIESDSLDEELIKKLVADQIASSLPSAPTDYSVDFFVEQITKQEDVFEREKDIIPLFGTKPCKDIVINGEIKEESIPQEILDLESKTLDVKEDFDDETNS